MGSSTFNIGASNLNELSDVGTATPTNGHVLVGDDTDFESRALTEADISDLGTYSTDIHANITALNAVSGTNTGDQTSIVGITGTKTQFDAAVTDGDFMYVGDAPTAHTHTASDITDFDTEVSNNASVTANTAKVGVTTEISDIVEDTTPQLGGDLELNEKSIEFNSNPTTDQTANGNYYTLTNVQGSAIGFGQLCSFSLSSAHSVVLADADSQALATLICIDSSVANSATGRFLFLGSVRDDDWNWTIGTPIYKSTTAGAMTQTVPSSDGDYVQVVGIATSADTIHFQPSYTQTLVGL
jgi:hypothetical protein